MLLKPTPDTSKVSQCFNNCFIRNIEFNCNRNSSQCIKHIVCTRQVQDNVHIRQCHAVAALDSEMHTCFLSANIECSNLCFFWQSVGCNGSWNLRQKAIHHRIIDTQNRCTIKRHSVQELDEGRFQLIEIMSIGFHMICIDICHHRHDGTQVEEWGIWLICLDDYVIPCP